MWIEIIGLPGVGKTTLVETNMSSIVKSYRIVKSNSNSILQKIICRILLFGFYSYRIEDRGLARKLAYRHSLRFFQKRSDNILFYDSGMVQVIIENLIETNFSNKDEKISILSYLIAPNKIIFLTDDIESIVHREINRRKRRFGFDLMETIRRYKKAQFLIENEMLSKTNLLIKLNSQENKKFIKAFCK